MKYVHDLALPCIPTDWPEFSISRQWRGATYQIKVLNPQGVSKGVKSIEVNGDTVTDTVPIFAAGSVNQVIVTLG